MPPAGVMFCFPSVSRGIVLAADVESLPELRSLASLSVGVPQVAGIKVGFSLALRHGLPAVVAAVKNVTALPVIYDHQKAATDIPAMGHPFAEVCREAGVSGVILFPQAGPRTLEAFAAAVIEKKMTPIVGLTMTHPAYLQKDGGFISDTAPDEIAAIARNLGVRSFVLPGNKAEVIARYGKGPLLPIAPAEILMPGIGTQGGSLAEAFKAADPHRPFAIIGSAVYKASDPAAALIGFAREVGQ